MKTRPVRLETQEFSQNIRRPNEMNKLSRSEPPIPWHLPRCELENHLKAKTNPIHWQIKEIGHNLQQISANTKLGHSEPAIPCICQITSVGHGADDNELSPTGNIEILPEYQ